MKWKYARSWCVELPGTLAKDTAAYPKRSIFIRAAYGSSSGKTTLLTLGTFPSRVFPSFAAAIKPRINERSRPGWHEAVAIRAPTPYDRAGCIPD